GRRRRTRRTPRRNPRGAPHRAGPSDRGRPARPPPPEIRPQLRAPDRRRPAGPLPCPPPQAGEGGVGANPRRDRNRHTTGAAIMISREPIYAALFDLIESAGAFVTAERRLRHWSDVAPAEQPALFQSQKSEVGAVKALGAPTVW